MANGTSGTAASFRPVEAYQSSFRFVWAGVKEATVLLIRFVCFYKVTNDARKVT